MKTTERDEARRLRGEHGLSIGGIAIRLGVSRSSVSRWVRDIFLTPAQHERLQGVNARHLRQATAAAVHRGRARHRRAWWQVEGRAAAARGGPRHAAASMLFWAEGSRSSNTVQLTNSDPELIRLFVRFLRDEFDLRDGDFRVACNLFADHVDRQRAIEDFWLDVVGAPRSSLTKTTLNRFSRSSRGKRTNRLPYGTCRVSVHRTNIAQHLLGAIQEYGGFDRLAWLEPG